MKLISLRVNNFRAIKQVQVNFFARGLTVIAGDNETGKSSLIEAIRFLFQFTDSSKDHKVKQLTPYGEDVPTFIELEFLCGPYKLLYSKQFNKSPATKLIIYETNSIEEPAEILVGRKAHERANYILDKYLDKFLWDALHVLQNERKENSLHQGFISSNSLKIALESAANALNTSRFGDNISEKIEIEFSKYYTKTGKETGKLAELRKLFQQSVFELKEQQKNISQLNLKIENYEKLIVQRASLINEKQTLSDKLITQVNTLNKLTDLNQELKHLAIKKEYIITKIKNLEFLIDELTSIASNYEKQNTELLNINDKIANLQQQKIRKETEKINLKDKIDKKLSKIQDISKHEHEYSNVKFSMLWKINKLVLVSWFGLSLAVSVLVGIKNIFLAFGIFFGFISLGIIARWFIQKNTISVSKVAILRNKSEVQKALNELDTDLIKLNNANDNLRYEIEMLMEKSIDTDINKQQLAQRFNELINNLVINDSEISTGIDSLISLDEMKFVYKIIAKIQMQLNIKKTEILTLTQNQQQLLIKFGMKNTQEEEFTQKYRTMTIQKEYYQKELNELDLSISKLDRDIAQTQAEIQIISNKGAHTDFIAAENACKNLESKFIQLDLQARAAKLLKETLVNSKQKTQAKYLLPFEKEITEIGQKIYGSSFAIKLNEDLSIKSRSLANKTVEYKYLSKGAREQLDIIIRLACAKLVAMESVMPVILDDAMGYSDSKRRKNLHRLFNIMAPEFQLILLTCNPDRFKEIPPERILIFQKISL